MSTLTPERCVELARIWRYVSQRYPLMLESILRGDDEKTIAKRLKIDTKSLNNIVRNLDFAMNYSNFK